MSLRSRLRRQSSSESSPEVPTMSADQFTSSSESLSAESKGANVAPSRKVMASLSPGGLGQYLTVPSLEDLGMMMCEAPPRRMDLAEKITLASRSQSWMIRTRHLIRSEHKPTPFVSYTLFLLSFLLIVLTLPFSLWFCFRMAREYERAVVFRLGRLVYEGTKGPGMFFIMPCIDSIQMVTVLVDAVIYFRISNPVISVTNVNDAQFSTKMLAQTTLRNVLGTKTLSEILAERDNIASVTEKVLDEGTDPWGVKVERVEVKDIRLPHVLMKVMAAEAEASRNAKAGVIAAEGEKHTSNLLMKAAETMGKSSSAMHLRYLQTLVNISVDDNHTIVLPLPFELLSRIANFKPYKSS